MKFQSFYELILENQNNTDTYVVFVEDDKPRTALITAYMKKFYPTQKYEIFDNNHDAAEFTKNHYASILCYSLDYHLYDYNSEPFAHFLRRMGNDGGNVFCHSDSPEGAEKIKEILPKSIHKQVPKNIVGMLDFIEP
jgi:hypothetical protein